MINSLSQVISKGEELSVGQGALYSIVAILMVFLILFIIIGVTTLVFKMNGLFDLKKELDAAKKGVTTNEVAKSSTSTSSKDVKIEDDDMMAAVLVATIDYRNEIKKDVRVVSVKRI